MEKEVQIKKGFFVFKPYLIVRASVSREHCSRK
jgi:hypothetical protein